MKLEEFFTEYDELVTGGINLDPLGMLVIWSQFGQKIFNNRVNSISNDVRNYTLNLFHHFVIRELINDDRYELSKPLKKVYGRKDSLDFKYACIVHLENIYVYSIIEAEANDSDVDSSGVLGSTKGRKKWYEDNSNPSVTFSVDKKYQILVRQLLLGVSGRYKTPLVEIGLFDRSYNYSLPDAEHLWVKADSFISGVESLEKLKRLLIDHLGTLIGEDDKLPTREFASLDESIKEHYIKAFKNSKTVGSYSRSFWLATTSLDLGAAGALLKVIDDYKQNSKTTDKEIFHKAKLLLTQEDESYWNIDAIEIVEPFLADVTLLFNLLRSKQTLSVEDVAKDWKSLGRNDDTLPNLADKIENDNRLIRKLEGSGKQRLQELLKLRFKTSLPEQVSHILEYHRNVMRRRGQSEWVRDKGSEVTAYIKIKDKPRNDDVPIGYWFNRYYLPQFTNLAKGLQGVSV